MPAPAANVTSVALLHVNEDAIACRRDEVATEEPLEIQLACTRRGLLVTRTVSVTMRTPGHDAELAAGFLFAEGIIAGPGQIVEITGTAPGAGAPAGARVVRVTLRDGDGIDLRPLERRFAATSSCGVCGKTSLAGLRATPRARLLPGVPVVDAAAIRGLPAALRTAQAGFDRTGGLHAAALFAPDGRLLAVREDVGRHNAVDKLVGAQLLAGRSNELTAGRSTALTAGRVPLGHCGLFVSGRASFELMQKAIMAGVPVLAAVGAPSSLAVDLAREAGATLLGFVREGRFNIYCGADRISGVPAATSGAPSVADAVA